MRTLTVKDIAQARFRDAAELWLQTRQFHLAPRTYEDYGHYIKILDKHFGARRILEITGDDVRSYQRQRMTTAGPSAINKELGVVVQIRKRIGAPLSDYQRLQQPKDWESPGRALTAAEEDKLEQVFRAAAEGNRKRWRFAALASLLSMKCGVGPGEIRSLRLKDVKLEPPTITIPRAGAKRERRERTIVLNASAAWALEKLVDRAIKECGCSLPDHFLCPRRNRDHTYDPTRRGGFWRGGHESLLAIAGIHVRPYDFRHHAVSRALQDPRVSLEAARAYYGWVSPKMIQRYFHADVTALRMVAEAADGARAAAETQVLRNEDVIGMLAGGLDAEIVIETIRNSFPSFDVSPQTLMSLKNSGQVPGSVLKEMVKAGRKAPVSDRLSQSLTARAWNTRPKG